MTDGMPAFPPPFESESPRRTGRWLLALIVVLLLGAGAAWWRSRTTAERATSVIGTVRTRDPLAFAPDSVRIRTRVINATGERGLARRATLYLRDFGYDVVDYDTQRGKPQEQTEIQSHQNSAEWASRVQRALGVGRVGVTPDSLRYVDVTVILGRDWKPPTEAFRP